MCSFFAVAFLVRKGYFGNLITAILGGRMLAAKLCEWITASVEYADDLHCKVLFNALDVLAEIGSEAEGKNLNVPSVMVNC